MQSSHSNSSTSTSQLEIGTLGFLGEVLILIPAQQPCSDDDESAWEPSHSLNVMFLLRIMLDSRPECWLLGLGPRVSRWRKLWSCCASPYPSSVRRPISSLKVFCLLIWRQQVERTWPPPFPSFKRKLAFSTFYYFTLKVSLTQLPLLSRWLIVLLCTSELLCHLEQAFLKVSLSLTIPSLRMA